MRISKSEDAASSEDELVQLLRAQSLGIPVVDNDLTRAQEINIANRHSKVLLEALLMSRESSTEKIATLMSCRPEMVELYKKYFFDVDVFRDHFDINDYIAALPNEQEQIVKRLAFQRGFHYIAAVFSGGALEMSNVDVMKALKAGAYQMFVQGISGPVTGEAAKEAKTWAGVLKGVMETMEKMAPSGAQSNFLAEFRVLFQSEAPIGSISAIEGEVIRG